MQVPPAKLGMAITSTFARYCLHLSLSARKGANYDKLVSAMKQAGYRMHDLLLNSGDCGVPQDRQRAYFVCVLEEFCDENFEKNFSATAEDLTIKTPLPLSQFVLPDSHHYIQEVMAMRKRTAERRRKPRPQHKGKKKAIKRFGNRWLVDHWKVRRQYGMLQTPQPEALHEIASNNGMCEREKDLLHLVTTVPCAERDPLRSVELKHSAPRVVRTKNKRRKDCTSCLLPASKIVLFPPVSGCVRYMTGLEALSLQGIPHTFHEATMQELKDSEYMSLAGNAFNAGSYALVVLSALSSMTLRRSQ